MDRYDSLSRSILGKHIILMTVYIPLDKMYHFVQCCTWPEKSGIIKLPLIKQKDLINYHEEISVDDTFYYNNDHSLSDLCLLRI